MKKQFRLEVRKSLMELSDVQFQAMSLQLSQRLYQFLKNSNLLEKPIGAFAPIQKEPDWGSAFQCPPVCLAYPSFEKGQMVFRRYLGQDFLKNLVSYLGGTLISPEVLIVPGLAFNRQGQRLGRGGGFYDRYLKTCKETLSIGVGFEMQVFGRIPIDSWDESVDILITEHNIYGEI